MIATIPSLTVIPGERNAPPDPDPSDSDLFRVIYEAGRSDERAAILGGLLPRRRSSLRHGARPGHLKAVQG